MKRSTKSLSIIAMGISFLFVMTSFMTKPAAALSKAQNFKGGAPILITSSNSSTSDNVNYVGNVQLTGAINASGTYTMPTEVLGMALHCTFILTLPQGKITIRMLCNMHTVNGRWTVLGGTGAYQNLRGGGSLTMPGTEEVLEGTVTN